MPKDSQSKFKVWSSLSTIFSELNIELRFDFFIVEYFDWIFQENIEKKT